MESSSFLHVSSKNQKNYENQRTKDSKNQKSRFDDPELRKYLKRLRKIKLHAKDKKRVKKKRKRKQKSEILPTKNKTKKRKIKSINRKLKRKTKNDSRRNKYLGLNFLFPEIYKSRIKISSARIKMFDYSCDQKMRRKKVPQTARFRNLKYRKKKKSRHTSLFGIIFFGSTILKKLN